ncbi:MAG: non-hydrolyzing UDP-N-acetylglucosamine 2-epimerase [Planctomycetota bacterium]
MDRKQIALVVGTRPEAIKMAPVYLRLREIERFDVRLLATAQHREMLDQVFEAFEFAPDVDLDLMRPNQGLSQVGSAVIENVQKVLGQMQPSAVLVHGDTSTTLFSAIGAFYERIPVGHVEAGLRTYNFDAPYPEEMNRRLTDPICRWCFAPTQRAAENLRTENIPDEKIFVTGNTVVDALTIARDKTRQNKPQIPQIPTDALNGRQLILVTGHRRESFGDPLREFCLALRDIVRSNTEAVLVYPVHLNPNVQAPVREILDGEDRIFLLEPLEYLPFVYLMDQCHLIITDSGGIQEEAPSLGKPVLVTREVTERPEGIEAGTSKLVGLSRERIATEAQLLLSDSHAYGKMIGKPNPYGDGHASERIAKILDETL